MAPDTKTTWSCTRTVVDASGWASITQDNHRLAFHPREDRIALADRSCRYPDFALVTRDELGASAANGTRTAPTFQANPCDATTVGGSDASPSLDPSTGRDS